jgi:ABC-type transport system involved in cytochrome bd biosynthesis fused ATPase/permease subunit
MKLSRKKSFALAIAFGAFALIGGTGLTVASAWLITMASAHPPIMVLGVSIVLVRFFGIFRSVSRYAERVLSHEAIFRKLTLIRVELFQSISSKLRGTSIANSVKTVIDDVERAQEFHLRITLPQYAAAISGATTILLAIWIDKSILPWIFLATQIFAFLIPSITQRWIDPLTKTLEERENQFAISISTASHAIVEAEHFGYGEQYRKSLQEQTKELAKLEKRLFARISWLQLLVTATLGLTLVGVALTTTDRSDLLPVTISMSIFLVLVGFEGYTTWFPNLFTAGKNRRADTSVNSMRSDSSPVHEGEVVLNHPVQIECKKFSPYWNEEIIKPLTFTLEPGETLVISGASGVGKSTFASAIFGFALYKGKITFNGISLEDLAPGAITGTLQHGHIFNTSLRENLKIADDQASDIRLQEILSAMELDSIDLDEVLGEFGRKLSGGEAKRLSVARALLSSAPIVILDEPLEHLDHERSFRIENAIANWCTGRTLIVITHVEWRHSSRNLKLERE